MVCETCGGKRTVPFLGTYGMKQPGASVSHKPCPTCIGTGSDPDPKLAPVTEKAAEYLRKRHNQFNGPVSA